MNYCKILDTGKVYLTKHDITKHYNVVLFSKFLTMITASSKYIDKFLIKRLVLPGSGTLNLISF
jgi:hypothetical protein